MEYVILVDSLDHPVGAMEKMEAHKRGLLHRAISVLLMDADGRVLLQRRALEKYHSGGLWTNTCCSHPRPGESPLDAANRRLGEEMGIECPLRHLFQFIYRAPLDHGLTEYELDHVFVGSFSGEPVLNTAEAMDYKWMDPIELTEDLTANPAEYTEWFNILYPQLLRKLEMQKMPA